MGLFDLFKAGDKKQRGKASPAGKWADRIEKRVQNYDRQEAIAALSELASAEAVEALLKRFSFNIDPSITDQEEKDSAFRGILRAEREAIEPVRAYAAKAESLSWPMKIMKALVGPDEYAAELLRWLSRWDTEYAKFVDPKVQILVALEDCKSPNIRPEVERFLTDVNEPARFHAVSTLLAQEDEGITPSLVQQLVEEESVRVRARIADGLASRGWPVPEDLRTAARKALPPPFSVDSACRIVKQ